MSADNLGLAEMQALPVGAIVRDGDDDRYLRCEPRPSQPTLVWLWIDVDDDEGWPSLRSDEVLRYGPCMIESTP